MEKSINQDNVVEFIRNNMEPVPLASIVSQFTGLGLEENNLKMMLHEILKSAINSGQLIRCNNHYFASSLPDDLLEVVDLNAGGDMTFDDADGDVISFSSCDSSDKDETRELNEQMEYMDSKEDEAMAASTSEDSKTDENQIED